MRCPLLVSERMLSRAKLSEVLSQLVVVLADLARWANSPLLRKSEETGHSVKKK